MNTPRNSAHGASLLEVLVTIVIMAIGLLGLAKLQVSNLRNNQNSLYRTEATFLASDILDSMRVLNNSSHDKADDYVVSVGSTAAQGPNTVAKGDVIAWKRRIALALPGGDASIAYDAASRIATIRIEWNDRRTGSADGCSSDAARPACFETRGGV